MTDTKTEYRVVLKFDKRWNMRDKVIDCKTEKRAQKIVDDMETDALGLGRVHLSPYWQDYEAEIQTREVTEWTRQ